MEETMEKIDRTVSDHEVVVFMKGNAEQPMCGFSEVAVEVLQSYDVEIETRDVLQSDELRRAIKEYSDWPTVPQVFIGGEFVGGSDIVREMHQKDDLKPLLEEAVEAGSS